MPKPRKDVSAAQRRGIVSRYQDGDGMKQIGDDLSHNVGVIRRILIEEGQTIRLRGRPHKTQ